MRKIICGTLVTLGFLGIFNLVGAIEYDKINLAGALIQTLVIGVIMYLSIRIGGFDK